MSEIVTGFIKPIVFKDLRAAKPKEDIRAAPDPEHPITSAMLAKIPELTYAHLEALRDYLHTHSPRLSNSNARDVDTWLKLVSDEMKRRDAERKTVIDKLAAGTISLADFLTTKGIR